MPFQRCIIRPGALGGFRIRAILSRNKRISVSHPPRQLLTWEYHRQESHDFTLFYKMSTAGFGVLLEIQSKKAPWSQDSGLVRSMVIQRVKTSPYRRFAHGTNIPPTVAAALSVSLMTWQDHTNSWGPKCARHAPSVRVWPCVSNSALFQCISDASPKLFHVLWCIVYRTLHVTQLCTAPCIHTSACATSACLFVCLPLSLVHVLLVLFVCFPFWIGSVNWWAVDQC